MDDTFVAIWPVDDANATLPALMALAEPDFHDQAQAAGLKSVGAIAWRLSPGRLTAVSRVHVLPAECDGERPWESPEAWLEDLTGEAA